MNGSMSAIVLLVLRVLLALALYAFLALALWTLWRELKRQGELLAARQIPPLTLSRSEDGQAQTITAAAAAILGREARCDFPLDDPTVSTQHARLAYHHGQWWVEDLHSTNGTYLNEHPVVEPAVLANGDVLRCGQIVVQVRLG